jgi:hypothetical protein
VGELRLLLEDLFFLRMLVLCVIERDGRGMPFASRRAAPSGSSSRDRVGFISFTSIFGVSEH